MAKIPLFCVIFLSFDVVSCAYMIPSVMFWGNDKDIDRLVELNYALNILNIHIYKAFRCGGTL